MPALRLALANIRFASTPDESVQLAKQAVEDAAAAGAAIVCFPECYVPGYRMPDSTMAPPDAAFLERAWATIADAARASNIAVILGTERVVGNGTRITALVINRDGSVGGFQDKVQLDPSEETTYVPGSMRQIFEVDGVKFAISICHEGWRYPETVRMPVRAGAQIVFHPHYHPPEPGSYRPETFGDPANTFHEKAMLCRAAENTCWFASVNYATEGSATTSAIVTPEGGLHTWQPYGKDGLLVADIDPDVATRLLAKRLRSS